VKTLIDYLMELQYKIVNGKFSLTPSIMVQILSNVKVSLGTSYSSEDIEFVETLFEMLEESSTIIVLNLLITYLSNREKLRKTIGDMEYEYHSLMCKSSYRLNSLKNMYIHAQITNNSDFTNAFSGRGCIYTVNVGNYDTIRPRDEYNSSFDYIIFTDKINQSFPEGYIVKELKNVNNLSPALLSRLPKILPHLFLSDYDYSIYVDGSIELKDDISSLINKYHVAESMLCCNHPSRDCIYDEALACKILQKDSVDSIDCQTNFFNAQGYPRNNGLIFGGILIRYHHDPLLIKVLDDWWKIVSTRSRRDQLSFNYCAWKNNYLYDTTDFVYYKSSFFAFHPHTIS